MSYVIQKIQMMCSHCILEISRATTHIHKVAFPLVNDVSTVTLCMQYSETAHTFAGYAFVFFGLSLHVDV